MFAIGLILFCIGMVMRSMFPRVWPWAPLTRPQEILIVLILAGGFLMLGSAALFFWRVMP